MSAQRSDHTWLLDMAFAARLVEERTRGLTVERLEQDLLLQDAVLHRLEIIGEAAGQLSEAFRTSHPELPWRRIVSFRNRLAHGYFEVDFERVWKVVREEIPPLILLLEGWLQEQGEEDKQGGS